MMKKLSLFAVLVLVIASPSAAATCGTDHPCKNPAPLRRPPSQCKRMHKCYWPQPAPGPHQTFYQQ